MDSYQEQFEALLVNLGKVLLPEMLWPVIVALLSCFPWMMHPLAKTILLVATLPKEAKTSNATGHVTDISGNKALAM